MNTRILAVTKMYLNLRSSAKFKCCLFYLCKVWKTVCQNRSLSLCLRVHLSLSLLFGRCVASPFFTSAMNYCCVVLHIGKMALMNLEIFILGIMRLHMRWNNNTSSSFTSKTINFILLLSLSLLLHFAEDDRQFTGLGARTQTLAYI